MKCKIGIINKKDPAMDTAMDDSQRETHLSRQIGSRHELLLVLDHEDVHYIRENISINQEAHQV